MVDIFLDGLTIVLIGFSLYLLKRHTFHDKSWAVLLALGILGGLLVLLL